MKKGERLIKSFTVSVRTLGGIGELKISHGNHKEYSGPIGSVESEELFKKLFDYCMFNIEDARTGLYEME